MSHVTVCRSLTVVSELYKHAANANISYGCGLHQPIFCEAAAIRKCGLLVIPDMGMANSNTDNESKAI